MEVKATFVISSEKISAERITELMGIGPHEVREIGEAVDSRSQIFRTHATWALNGHANGPAGDDLEAEIEKVISILNLRKHVLEELRNEGCHFSWWCLVFHRTDEKSIHLSPKVLRSLSVLDSEIFFDVYSIDDDDDPGEGAAD